MSGRARLAGRRAAQGEPRSARLKPVTSRITPVWRVGDRVRWQGRDGVFRREIGDTEHAEISIGERVYRVRVKELGWKAVDTKFIVLPWNSSTAPAVAPPSGS